MAAILVLIFVGLLPCLVFGLRSQFAARWLWPSLGWLGAVLALVSVFLLPWLQAGPPHTFRENIAWVVGKSQVLEELSKLPIIKDQAAGPRAFRPQDIRAQFEAPGELRLIGLAERGQVITGLEVFHLARPFDPFLAGSMAVGVLALTPLLVVSLYRLIHGQVYTQAWLRVFVVILALAVLNIVGRVAFLDSLGEPEEFRIRMLAAFLELKVASGAWVMALGCLISALSTLPDWAPSLADTRPTVGDDPDYNWKYEDDDPYR